MSLEDLYKEVILDHYKSPRNKRDLPGAPISCTKNNPLCGDEITVRARFDDGRVTEVAFEGQGCSISQASASLMTEAVTGEALEEAGTLTADCRGMMEGKGGPA